MASTRWQLLPALVCVVLVPTAAGGDRRALLQQLPQEYASAPWDGFVSESGFTAFTKELKHAEKTEGDMTSRPAVVKVLARARVPVRALLDTFLSQDAAVVSEWNPFAGEVRHLDGRIQLQTYRLPWPFASREYLVQCEDCLLYTSPSPRDKRQSRMPSSA